MSTFGQIRLWTSLESSPVSVMYRYMKTRDDSGHTGRLFITQKYSTRSRADPRALGLLVVGPYLKQGSVFFLVINACRNVLFGRYFLIKIERFFYSIFLMSLNREKNQFDFDPLFAVKRSYLTLKGEN